MVSSSIFFTTSTPLLATFVDRYGVATLWIMSGLLLFSFLVMIWEIVQVVNKWSRPNF